VEFFELNHQPKGRC